MLVRGAICRVAATHHHLPRVARSWTRSPALRNVSSALAARSTGSRNSGRSYATATTQATKPTAKVKRDVKKAAASKKTTTKTKKTAAKKSTATKKAAPKKKKKTTKAAAAKAKPKRAKKVLTPEEKDKAAIKALKVTALKAPLWRLVTAWNAFVADKTTGAGAGRANFGSTAKPLGQEFRSFTPAELEHYNHIASERTAARRAEYDAWIQSHTPEQIRLANTARSSLRRKLATAKMSANVRRQLVPLKDDRQLKAPMSPYLLFHVERTSSADFKNIALRDAAKLVSQEWKALSAGEKKQYEDEAESRRATWIQEYEKVYGHAPPSAHVSEAP